MTEELDRLKAKAEGMGLHIDIVSNWLESDAQIDYSKPNANLPYVNKLQMEGVHIWFDSKGVSTAETLLALRDPKAVRVVDFIEAEPEFPDEMPDELLNTFRETVGCDIRKGMAELICRVIVKVTKEAIIKRLPKAPDGYEYVVIERKVVE